VIAVGPCRTFAAAAVGRLSVVCSEQGEGSTLVVLPSVVGGTDGLPCVPWPSIPEGEARLGPGKAGSRGRDVPYSLLRNPPSGRSPLIHSDVSNGRVVQSVGQNAGLVLNGSKSVATEYDP
jgi:hypothetical protein